MGDRNTWREEAAAIATEVLGKAEDDWERERMCVPWLLF